MSTRVSLRGIVFVAVLLLAGCAASRVSGGGGKGHGEEGIASYYAHAFHGKTTANGETYDMHAHTAAHRSLPFNTRVRVTNLDNGESVELRINDRGPFVKGRIIDVSYRAAKDLDFVRKGLARVVVDVLD